MDKTPFENEDRSSTKSNKIDPDRTMVVKPKKIDVLSLSKSNTSSTPDNEPPLFDEQPLDESWLILSQDWQDQPFEKVDIQKLLKQTKKRTLLAKLLLALNVIATVGIFIMLFVGLYQGDWSTANITYLSFGGVASVIFVYYEIKIRLHIWQQSCDSPDKAVTNAIAGVQSSIKYIKLTKLSCWLFLPLVNWYLYATIEESEKSLWPPFIITHIFILMIWLITHWFQKKRFKELSELNSI